MPDCFFEQNEHNLIEIIKQIRRFRPEIILANSITDRHPDHGRGAELVARAAFLAGLPKIESTFEGKKQAAFRARLLLHYIQDQYIAPESTEPETPISQANFFDFMKGRMRQFGRPIGVEFAEGFTTNRLIGVNSLFDLI